MANVSSADILAAIQALPQGGTRTQILEKLGNPFSGRQLSRYLAPLEKVGRIRTERAGKEVLYFMGSTRQEERGERGEDKAQTAEVRSLASEGNGQKSEPHPTTEPKPAAKPGQTEDKSEVGSQTSEVSGEKPKADATAGLKAADDGAKPAESVQGKPTEPAAKPTEPAADAPGTAAGIDPDFPDMAEVVALDVVLGGLTKPAAVLLLKKAAQEYHKEGAAVMAFVRYALQRIDRVTPEEVEDLGVDPEQFAAWQRRWAGDYGYTQDPASDSGSTFTVQGSPSDATDAADGKAGRERPSRDSKPGSSKDKTKANAGTRSSSNADRLPEVPLSEAALRTSTSAILAKALTDWLGRWMPGLTRTQRVAATVIVGALVIVLYKTLGQYKWWGIVGAPVLSVLGLLVFGAGVGRNGNKDQRPGTKDRPDKETGDETPETRHRWRVRGWYFIWAAAGLALVAGGAWYLWFRPAATPAMPKPPEDVVREYLVKNAGPLPVRLADLRVTYGNATDTNCRLTYEARFETTDPLFRRIDATEYLRGRVPAPISDFKFQISDVGPAPTPALESLVLVTTATPPGTSVAAAGTLVAWKHDTTWIFTGDPVRLDRSTLAGDPKPAGALAVDLPEDAARLQALIGDQVAYAAKVQAAAKALAVQRERDVQQRKAAFSELLRVGTLFTGVVNDPTKHQPQRFVLEITGATGSRLTAVLRNEGGWTDVRPFQGEWSVDAAGEVATVTLRTASTAAIDGAGPLLQDRMEWGLVFALRANAEDVRYQTSEVRPNPANAGATGDLKSQISNFTSAALAAVVQRVDASSVADLRTDWTRGVAAVLAATRAGAVYRGTALSKIYRTTETVWLRFGARGAPITSTSTIPDVLDATLSTAANGSGGRAFRGTIIANTYRAGGNPIRLQSADSDRVAGADGHKVLGVVTGAGLSMALRLDADRLVGEDGWFTYAFAPAPADANADFKFQISDFKDGGGGNAEGGTRNANTGAQDGNVEIGTRNAEGSAIPQSEIRTPQSLPPFPAAAGAYGLANGRWVALPTNNGLGKPKEKRILDGLFSALETLEQKIGGQPKQPPEQIWGALTFDGHDPVPWLPADGVVICYVGELKPIPPARLKKYPMLELEPLMELGRLQTVGGTRSMLVTAIYPDIPGFGPRHIEATVEQRAPNVVLLRCAVRLDVGRYAVTCNDQAFELGVIAN